MNPFPLLPLASEVAAAVPSGGAPEAPSFLPAALPRGRGRDRSAARGNGGYLLHLAAFAFWLFVPLLGHAQTNPGDQVGQMASTDLHIDKATLHTKVAATPAQEERGLMFVTKMPDNDGMIFILPLGRAEFWMKNTLIPLSVAFIDKNGVILEIHDMQPGDPALPDNELPRTKSDSEQVQYALETNLHWFALNSIKPGDKIDITAVEKTELKNELSLSRSLGPKSTPQTNAPPH